MMSRPPNAHWRHCLSLFALIALVAAYPAAAADRGPSTRFHVQRLELPEARGLVVLDYFAYDRRNARVWVPAGNLGVVAVIDSATDRMTTVTGFRTGAMELLGRRRVLGPTSVSLGDGLAYIGNRADASICVVEAETLMLQGCTAIGDPAAGLSAAPDAVVYVAATHELWVTTGAPPLGIPAADRSLLILDASDPKHLREKSKLVLDGSAEGYAVDDERGLFYTSIEERGETVAIDVRRKQIVSRWRSGCKEPHGIALDRARRFLFVACADRVIALDAVHGKALSSIATGEGLDNIDYAASERMLYAAAADAATLTVARVDDRGRLKRVATIPTVKGARSVIAGGPSTAYLIDPSGASILKISLR